MIVFVVRGLNKLSELDISHKTNFPNVVSQYNDFLPLVGTILT